MKCPECGSQDLEKQDFLIYYSDGNDYKCNSCGCEFDIFKEGKEREQ